MNQMGKAEREEWKIKVQKRDEMISSQKTTIGFLYAEKEGFRRQLEQSKQNEMKLKDELDRRIFVEEVLAEGSKIVEQKLQNARDMMEIYEEIIADLIKETRDKTGIANKLASRKEVFCKKEQGSFSLL